jgi:hypothetical protein
MQAGVARAWALLRYSTVVFKMIASIDYQTATLGA